MIAVTGVLTARGSPFLSVIRPLYAGIETLRIDRLSP